ncbi:ABC transporter ATP-binding protein [soil metagenome]
MSRSDIELHEVSKRYRSSALGGPRTVRNLNFRSSKVQWALRDISLDVQAGETFGLIGRNGSGKSTALRIMAGITSPTTGRVHNLRRVSGLLTIGEGLQPLLTGEENALTASILAGLTKREALRRLSDIARFAELEDHMDHPLRTYSDGMKLRLAFSVSLHVDPEILLIDEVLAVGDIRFQEKCFVALEGFQSEGVTISVTSHDMGQIRRLCDRVAWLVDGRIKLIGDTDEVASRYENAMSEGVPEQTDDTATRRLGSGEIQFKAVQLLDRWGAPLRSIPAGSRVHVVAEYEAEAPVNEPIFGVSVHEIGSGTRLLDLDTRSAGLATGTVKGGGRVELILDHLDLTAGEYALDIGVYETEWARPYDYLWEKVDFEITSSSTSGLVAPPHRWKLA